LRLLEHLGLGEDDMNRKTMNRRILLKSGAMATAALGLAGASASGAKAETVTAPTALRAEWYDLDPAKAASFIAWLHDDHLPRLKAAAGVLWVGHYKILQKTRAEIAGNGRLRAQTDDPTVPTGSQYVLLAAGASPETFLAWDCPVAALESSARERLATRLNYRQAVFLEELRVDGPDNGPRRNSEAPPTMQLGNFNVRTPDDDLELAHFYRLQRFPQVAVAVGSIGARKYVSTIGWPKHGVLYEFSSIEPGEQSFEKRMSATLPKPPIKLKAPGEYVVHAPGAPHVGSRIWP
jgi:hypothetical protein